MIGQIQTTTLVFGRLECMEAALCLYRKLTRRRRVNAGKIEYQNVLYDVDATYTISLTFALIFLINYKIYPYTIFFSRFHIKSSTNPNYLLSFLFYFFLFHFKRLFFFQLVLLLFSIESNFKPNSYYVFKISPYF